MANIGRFDYYTACPGVVNEKDAVVVLTSIDGYCNQCFAINPDQARRFADDILRAANTIDPINEEDETE